MTFIYISGSINAFNVTDGMDGLCVLSAMISLLGFIVIAYLDQNIFVIQVGAIMFLSLLGFFPYNFNPAKIFLGDSGSYFIGYTIGVLALLLTGRSNNFISFLIPILLIGFPVFDMAVAIFRRVFILKKHPFLGDRDHLYDLLLQKDMTQKKVLLYMSFLQMFFVISAIFIKIISKGF